MMTTECQAAALVQNNLQASNLHNSRLGLLVVAGRSRAALAREAGDLTTKQVTNALMLSNPSCLCRPAAAAVSMHRRTAGLVLLSCMCSALPAHSLACAP